MALIYQDVTDSTVSTKVYKFSLVLIRYVYCCCSAESSDKPFAKSHP